MIIIVLYLFVFISGLFIGSFLNVVSDRIVNGLPIFIGRSQCDFCKKPLMPRDLIPLLSYLIQKGRCRYCKKSLNSYYPLSELLTGCLFVAMTYHVGIFTQETNPFIYISLFYLLVVSCFYIILTLTDLKYRLLPNRVVFAAIAFVLIFVLLNSLVSSALSYYVLKSDPFGKYLVEAGYWSNQVSMVLRNHAYDLISSLCIGLFFWLLTLIKNGKAMGGGDVKLAVLIGLFNGFSHNILAIFLGFFTGAVFSLLAILLRFKSIKDTIPFGPFLILGSIVTLFWGDFLLNWYLGLFL